MNVYQADGGGVETGVLFLNIYFFIYVCHIYTCILSKYNLPVGKAAFKLSLEKLSKVSKT